VAVAASAAVLSALAAACGSAGGAAAKDVTLTSCGVPAGGGHPVAMGQVHNQSSKASAYLVHVKFLDASNNSVGDGVATVASVNSGATATLKVTSTSSAQGALHCQVASVTRTVAP
jgi:hypothetical protein